MKEEKKGAMPKGHMKRYHPNGIQEGDTCKYISGVIENQHSTGTENADKKGSLPEYLENIVHKMLNPNEMQKGVVMDSGISQTDLQKIHPMYLLRFDNILEPPEGKIAWYDQKSGEYRIFKTHDEMMRTVLPIFQMREGDINRILKAKKNEGRKWNSWEISMILMDWLYLGKSIEEIIERN